MEYVAGMGFGDGSGMINYKYVKRTADCYSVASPAVLIATSSLHTDSLWTASSLRQRTSVTSAQTRGNMARRCRGSMRGYYRPVYHPSMLMQPSYRLLVPRYVYPSRSAANVVTLPIHHHALFVCTGMKSTDIEASPQAVAFKYLADSIIHRSSNGYDAKMALAKNIRAVDTTHHVTPRLSTFHTRVGQLSTTTVDRCH